MAYIILETFINNLRIFDLIIIIIYEIQNNVPCFKNLGKLFNFCCKVKSVIFHSFRNDSESLIEIFTGDQLSSIYIKKLATPVATIIQLWRVLIARAIQIMQYLGFIFHFINNYLFRFFIHF